ncbi:MAG: excinuclease ABC subunit UvrA [Mangrovibacterium sp.]
MSQIKSNQYIHIKGARVHNLKNIELKIPRNKFIVVTGLSGSGKSSLAFDTLYAEGQRRYVESLSSYARQFLGRLDKPEVDFIKGIPPAIAIEQKVNSRNPRSTVGTSTEIYDYIKLLFARIGKTISPISGKEVKRHSVSDVVNFVISLNEGTKVMICSPIPHFEDRTMEQHLDLLAQQGFSRIDTPNGIMRINQVSADTGLNSNECMLIIDRITANSDNDNLKRIADSVQTALFEGRGECIIKYANNDNWESQSFSNKFEADGITFEEPSEHLFSFNNPVGACPRCEGYGKVIGIDPDLVIPDKTLSVYQDAVACWRGETLKSFKEDLILHADKFHFPIHIPYCDLSDKEKKLLWNGNSFFEGINSFFQMVESNGYKIQYRVLLARYRGKTNCPDCGGSRLKKEAAYVKVGNISVQELVLMPINELRNFFENLKLNKHDEVIGKRILIEITNRIDFLCDVGLGYLTLNRLSATLSGGESQRINLATSLGSSLVGSIYILDEPSIGLHPKDTERLINVLRKLQCIGNTVLVVEHDEEIIRAADEIIDIGPKAGVHGGEVIFQGNHQELLRTKNSLTADYITRKKQILPEQAPRKWNNYIEVVGAQENNLKNISVKFPLNCMTVVSGVSGSGKSTLISRILYPGVAKALGITAEKAGKHALIRGDIKQLSSIEFVDQNPIGKSSRSNPVTYLKAYDEIRKLYAELPASKHQGYKASHFSFNIDGGRCEECQGEGFIHIEMQFMADVTLECESCKGKRFKEDILEIKHRGKNIFDILQMSINQAIDFFSSGKSNLEQKIAVKLKPLFDVGLGYIQLGQSSSTLSGGESQRVKLAAFLSKENQQPTLFIFDEPTTGLHFYDVDILLKSLNSLINRGHSVLIIEHNLDVINCADWLIDLGPEGGENGGTIVFEGKPEEIIHCKESFTGEALKLQTMIK